ncbi:lactate utilization protein C [Arenibacter sp. NBRC 103722]|uniref:LutC/YkgG family protein n=1 Tax=Arenibacter sp. NBRC 103722 TaxID=1113929 RepID=UPI0008532B36|nr:LUD domain-containing protein [Arenibacter sp. NBRC 103722]GBF21817.1 lactate utilization protein C [Arenibacter sp. NBRC 103722]
MKEVNSRTNILNQIKENKPNDQTNIELGQFFIDENENSVNKFCQNLVDNDGDYIILDRMDNLQDLLLKEINGRTFVDLTGNIVDHQSWSFNGLISPKKWSDIEVSIINGIIGVAENGAVWLDDDSMQNIRTLPFIVDHTIFILNVKQIVPTMHHAYKTLGKIKTGFGTFIAGPSKTGDIEQNLIIGAHGPLSHLVILVSSSDSQLENP